MTKRLPCRRNDQSGRNGDGGGTRTTATVVDLETTATVVDPEATATVVDLEATATVVDLEETATVVDVEATATVWMWKQRLRWWERKSKGSVSVHRLNISTRQVHCALRVCLTLPKQPQLQAL
ncbi:hypothetical protein F2Q69_00034985 [Brassica cretica]|uniref:Uncharacterized protein n=1 Tax=Brassica cretica TaxID=69181 RepID=A0A8S9SLI4_BRACR|nr:hypothetical protein F2Q69_00034985 [Brassica cretica]